MDNGLRMASGSAKSSGGWTIPILCVGLALLACCAIVPQVEENRQAVWEREKLARDLAHLDKQIEVNDEFLSKLGNDPALAERLAQRQMKMIRSGTGVLELKGDPVNPATAPAAEEMSPFLLVSVPPPAPLPDYKPSSGVSQYFLEKRPSTYIMGGAFFLVAIALVVGSAGAPRSADETSA